MQNIYKKCTKKLKIKTFILKTCTYSFILFQFNTFCFADNYYKDYYKRAIKLVIPEANAQGAPQVLPNNIAETAYKVPELKTDAKAVAQAQSIPSQVKHKKSLKSNLNANKAPLDKKAQKGLLVSEQLTHQDDISAIGINGYVTFQYGQGQPTVICATNNVCSIKLQENEKVSAIKIGNQSEWQVQDVISKENTSLVTSITITPNVPNTQTNLLIFTDRRQYNIKLLSHSTKYMPLVSFRYADELQTSNKVWDLKYKIAEEKEKQTLKQQQEIQSQTQYALSAKNLDFNYQMNGNAAFKPTRVYTDGIKTYIELPDAINGNELPAFISQTQDKKERLVNYKYDADTKKYVIDQKLRNGLLIAGKEKIEIAYKGK